MKKLKITNDWIPACAGMTELLIKVSFPDLIGESRGLFNLNTKDTKYISPNNQISSEARNSSGVKAGIFLSK